MTEQHNFDYRLATAVGPLDFRLLPGGSFESTHGGTTATRSRAEVAGMFAGKIIEVCMDNKAAAADQQFQAGFRPSHGYCKTCFTKALAELKRAA